MAKKRRTAEESRSIILEAAAERLKRSGLEGLNITGVAEQAGLSHATLIHHFGSSGGMREALAAKMTVDLVDDLVAAFAANVPVEDMTRNVFKALTEGGHARLIAWRSVEGSSDQNMEQLAPQFKKLVESAGQNMPEGDDSELRYLIMLVSVAAIGFGLAGQNMATLLNMNEADAAQFPDWLVQRVSGLN